MKSMHCKKSAGVIAGISVALCLAGVARAASIGVQFQGTGTPLASGDSAGVVAQSHWNVVTGFTGFNSGSLADSAGAGTTAAFSGGGGDGTFASTSTFTAGTGNNKLASGEIYHNLGTNIGFLTPTAGNSITFTGIPYSQYDVYVYGESDAGGRETSFKLTPSGGSSAIQSFTSQSNASVWTAGAGTWNATGTPPGDAVGNYVKFTGLTANGFVLQFGGAPSVNGSMNGIEIVSTPEPASLGLLGIAATTLLFRKRRPA